MNKDTSITIRLNQSLKDDFDRAVHKEVIQAIAEGKDFNHITTSEIVRAMIKTYCRRLIQ